MAEEEIAEESEEEGEKKGGGGSKTMLFVIIGVVVLLLIIGIVVAVLLMGGDEEEAAAEEGDDAGAAKDDKSRKPKSKASLKSDLTEIGPMYAIDEMIVNLVSQSGRRYLKTKISLEMSDPALQAELTTKAGAIRDTILGILSSKTIEEIQTIKGKQKLKEEMASRLNEFLVDGQVVNIFFTQFVMQ